jgi:hypothetical protein
VIPQADCPPGEQQARNVLLLQDAHRHRSGAQARAGDADTPEVSQVGGDGGPVHR